MKKYFRLISITFQNYFVYRLSFLLWRFRSVVFYSSLLFFWIAVYNKGDVILGYEKMKMLTYVVLIAFLRSFVLGSTSGDLAGQIMSGRLNVAILRPINFFKFWFVRDIPDKILNVFFTLVELTLVVKFLGISIHLPSPMTFVLCIFFVTLSMVLAFFISMCLSMISFWTQEVWAMRWLFGIIFLEFFSGLFFPIDVMPGWFGKIVGFTPFPYLIYYPAQMWLGALNGLAILKVFFVTLFWLAVFYYSAHKLLKNGLKSYGAYGG